MKKFEDLDDALKKELEEIVMRFFKKVFSYNFIL